uniref:Uncharacterized protein n=1 Tax=Anopheles atroparvus TaxID=41427 RepID=A0A182JMG8_ANOAO
MAAGVKEIHFSPADPTRKLPVPAGSNGNATNWWRTVYAHRTPHRNPDTLGSRNGFQRKRQNVSRPGKTAAKPPGKRQNRLAVEQHTRGSSGQPANGSRKMARLRQMERIFMTLSRNCGPCWQSNVSTLTAAAAAPLHVFPDPLGPLLEDASGGGGVGVGVETDDVGTDAPVMLEWRCIAVAAMLRSPVDVARCCADDEASGLQVFRRVPEAPPREPRFSWEENEAVVH